MKLTLDGQPIDAKVIKACTLSGLIKKVENRLGPERVIISMTLDGELLDTLQEQSRATDEIEKLEHLDIQTQSVQELARNTLDTLIEYIPTLIQTASDSVVLIQGADPRNGHQSLRTLIDGLQMIASAWTGIAQTLNIKGLTPEDVIPDMEIFNALLNHMCQAQEDGDLVCLCDLIEFDLSSQLKSWEKHAQDLRKKLAR